MQDSRRKVVWMRVLLLTKFYLLLAPKLELARGDQFHWRPEAYTILAETVTNSVLRELDQHDAQ